MNWNSWIRRFHRWTAAIFTVIVVVIFAMLGAGKEPVQWVYYLPLFPLALLMITGLYMFVRHYAAKWRKSAG